MVLEAMDLPVLPVYALPVVIAVSYPYYPYPYPYLVPPVMYDPMYLMYMMMQWLWVPYYFALTIEIYRTMIDAWRKSIETMTKAIESYKEISRG